MPSHAFAAVTRIAAFFCYTCRAPRYVVDKDVVDMRAMIFSLPMMPLAPI